MVSTKRLQTRFDTALTHPLPVTREPTAAAASRAATASGVGENIGGYGQRLQGLNIFKNEKPTATKAAARFINNTSRYLPDH
jgi:hypothetical protein